VRVGDSEARRLRIDDKDRLDDLARGEQPPVTGSLSLVAVTTVVSAYPTGVGQFFACTPQGVLGTETEGTAGVISPLAGVVYALLLGSAVPPLGTKVVLTKPDHRWVFRYDGP